jgi:hypothetical protein
MANPTTNFGWVMPTSTDLVTDLPADFNVFGQGVDTSMADLLGGTTGQVLSKTSATNMDFTWVTPQVGDITSVVAGTGITGGGTSGAVTVSFDQENYGGGQYAAGKNKVINGAFQVWQRGTSSSSLGNYYTADRWYQGAWSGTGTWAQETTTVPTGSRYAIKFTASATAQPYLFQAIETNNAIAFAGKSVTFSAQFAASTSVGITMQIGYSTSVDNGIAGTYTDITPTSGGTVTPTSTTYVTGSGVYAIPSTAKTLRIGFQTTSTIANTVVIYATNAQVEVGSTATPFQTASGSIGGELALCQRYYWRQTASSTYSRFSTAASADSTTVCSVVVIPPVAMRTPPTAIEYSTVTLYGGAFVTSVSSVTLGADSTTTNLIAGVVGVGLTAFRAYNLLANNSASAYLAFTAEL